MWRTVERDMKTKPNFVGQRLVKDKFTNLCDRIFHRISKLRYKPRHASTTGVSLPLQLIVILGYERVAKPDETFLILNFGWN